MTKIETLRIALVLLLLLGLFVLAALAPLRSYRLKVGEFVYEPAVATAPVAEEILTP